MKSFTSNLTGRKLDISFVDFTSSTTNEMSFTGSFVVTGILKLAQKFAMILLTPRGSELTDRRLGTSLTKNLQNRSVSNVESLIRIYVADALELVKQLQNDPAERVERFDERIDSVKVQRINTSNDRISIDLLVRSESGQSVEIVLPYKVR